MIGHALRNLEDGVGGPKSAEVLWNPASLSAQLSELGLRVESCQERARPVEGGGAAIDLIVRAAA